MLLMEVLLRIYSMGLQKVPILKRYDFDSLLFSGVLRSLERLDYSKRLEAYSYLRPERPLTLHAWDHFSVVLISVWYMLHSLEDLRKQNGITVAEEPSGPMNFSRGSL